MTTSAIIGAIGFLVLGLLAAWIGKRSFGLTSAGVYASLFFAPILSYLVLSGQLQTFKGLGVEATFREVANKRIEVHVPIREAVGGKKHGDIQALFGGGSDVALFDVEAHSARSGSDMLPIAFELGEAIAASIAQGTFELLIGVDGKGRVQGYLPKHWFLDLLALPSIHSARGNDPDFNHSDRKGAERALRKTYLWDVLVRPERIKEWGRTKVISSEATYVQAYRALVDEKLSAMPVVDGAGAYVGIIRRRDVESRLLSALLDG